jgi:tRNA threonylcarbamoyladenosine biosynthesis protein TsaE
MLKPAPPKPAPARRLLADCSLTTPEATASFARALAPRLGPGDCLCLEGDLGAGKTHFARAVIQARLAAFGLAEDVPSPTFTLVQTYQAGGLEIWHSDLYRLTNAQEMDELGLSDAFDTGLCLIEWPGRVADEMPVTALWLTLTMLPDAGARQLRLESARPEAWRTRLAGILPQ